MIIKPIVIVCLILKKSQPKTEYKRDWAGSKVPILMSNCFISFHSFMAVTIKHIYINSVPMQSIATPAGLIG